VALLDSTIPPHAQRPHNFKRTELCARRDRSFLSSSEAQFRTTFTCIAWFRSRFLDADEMLSIGHNAVVVPALYV